jgi:glycine/sarcosine N-methyltransferase
MNSSVTTFYDDLATDYHLIFKDWDEAIIGQSEVLDNLIREQTGKGPPLRLYDCSCGIGTQALGLAARGYQVHATDLSPKSVERAQTEASKRGLDMTFGVADFRTLAAQVDGEFDVVIACDNSLPHLLTDNELAQAAENIYAKAAPGGLLLASIRDYDAIIQEKPTSVPVRINGEGKNRRVVFQIWDWLPESDRYTVNHFILNQPEHDQWTMKYHVTTYRALTRDTMSNAFEQAGFTAIQWHMPENSGYYQPVMTAQRNG